MQSILGKSTVEVDGNVGKCPTYFPAERYLRCPGAPPRRASEDARRRRTSRITFSLTPSTWPNCSRNSRSNSSRLGSVCVPSPHFDRAQSMSFGTGSPAEIPFFKLFGYRLAMSAIWTGRGPASRHETIFRQMFEQVTTVDAQVEQDNFPGPLIDRVNPLKFRPCVFDRVDVLVWPAWRSAGRCPRPRNHISVQLPFQLRVTTLLLDFRFLQLSERLGPLLRVGIRGHRNYRASRDHRIRLQHQQIWVRCNQAQHEVEISCRREHDSLWHIQPELIRHGNCPARG